MSSKLFLLSSLCVLVFVATGCGQSDRAGGETEVDIIVEEADSNSEEKYEEDDEELILTEDEKNGIFPQYIVQDDGDSEETKIEKIKLFFSKKYNKDIKNIQVSIAEDSGNFVMGGVSLSDDLGDQGLYFAAKVDGEWQVAWDGNGIPTCDVLGDFNFPMDLMVGCYLEDVKTEAELKADEIFGLLNGLRTETGMAFNDIVPNKYFEWNDGNEYWVIEGHKAVAVGFEENADTTPVQEYFQSKGFQFDVNNMSDGTVESSVGYKKDDIVCKISNSFDSGVSGGIIEVYCAVLELE